MKTRYLWFITLLLLCHPYTGAQTLTNAVPPPVVHNSTELPDDPSQELMPTAKPESHPMAGMPIRWDAAHQARVGDVWTLSGEVVVYYNGYILKANKVVYHHDTDEIDAEGELQLAGGPEAITLNADHGVVHPGLHTARFYQVNGSMGVRGNGHEVVYTSANPFLFTGRELLQLGEGNYKVVDGSMTNCNLPRPDWTLFSKAIELRSEKASAKNTFFKLKGVPLFYLPYIGHPINQEMRQSGFLIPVFGLSTTRGFTLGEQVYIVLGRSADLTIGAEFYSDRGFAPNGDFRYRGSGLNEVNFRWHALLDRRVGPGTTPNGNQGGVDILADLRKDFTENTHIAGSVEYLSNYIYRLVFDNNYSMATNSEVRSTVGITSNHGGYLLSGDVGRFQSYVNSTPGGELRILRLPGLQFEMLDRPLFNSPFYVQADVALDHLGRAEPGLHARNALRMDIHPSISMPIHAGEWNFVPTFGMRLTGYTNSQVPTSMFSLPGVPTVSHDALLRKDLEFSFDIRPPAIERDFQLPNHTLRHVIEPEIYYHFVTGIGAQAQDVLLVDTRDIATNVNEVGFSITQRFYVRSNNLRPCDTVKTGGCEKQREWASWQIGQKYFFDNNFAGALITGRRNVFDAALDFNAVTFLTDPRNASPIVSRMRFEAVKNLRVEWDFDYDPRAGRILASNVYSGYSWGRATIGFGHSFLNAPDELSQAGTLVPILQNQQLQPYFQFGKPTDTGLSVAANGGYDLARGQLQYGGIQAVYNHGCCGITAGYRRFSLGSLRDEVQYLYGFTLAGFGNAGDVRRSNSIFRDPKDPPIY
jgi:LPS-assembly protein